VETGSKLVDPAKAVGRRRIHVARYAINDLFGHTGIAAEPSRAIGAIAGGDVRFDGRFNRARFQDVSIRPSQEHCKTTAAWIA
jgi:hypothetical protein